MYVAAPLLLPTRGSSLRWLLDRGWAALTSTHMYDTSIFSTYTRVLGSVSIHNLRTVAPRYGELLALLVFSYSWFFLTASTKPSRRYCTSWLTRCSSAACP